MPPLLQPARLPLLSALGMQQIGELAGNGVVLVPGGLAERAPVARQVGQQQPVVLAQLGQQRPPGGRGRNS